MIRPPRLIIAAACAAAIGASSQAFGQGTRLPRPGLVIEWRQNADIGGPVTVRQEILSVAGSAVRYSEITLGGAGGPVAYETWRGLVLIKRHIPPSPAFTESTATFTIDVPALEGLVPMAPGRYARIEIKGRTASRLGTSPTAPFMTGDIVGQLSVRIERRETLALAAGRFDTVVIRHEVTLEQPGMNNRATVAARVWFAPALGWPVKKQQFGENGAVKSEAVVIRVTQPR